MTIKKISRLAILAALLYVIYSSGSVIPYVELFNFTLLLFSVNMPRKDSFIVVLVFSFILLLVYGVAPWTMMYLLVFPMYTQIYFYVAKKLKSEFMLAIVGFILAFMCGTLIDLPYIFMSGLVGESLVFYMAMGFRVSLGNGLSTFLATLYLYQPLAKRFNMLYYAS